MELTEFVKPVGNCNIIYTMSDKQILARSALTMGLFPVILFLIPGLNLISYYIFLFPYQLLTRGNDEGFSLTARIALIVLCLTIHFVEGLIVGKILILIYKKRNKTLVYNWKHYLLLVAIELLIGIVFLIAVSSIFFG